MSSLPAIYPSFLTIFLVDLLNTPSPTGNAEPAIAYVEKTLQQFPALTLSRTRKGALVACWEGIKNDAPRALTAHVDTLGAMVKEIKLNGRLKLTRIGGLLLNGVETEGCWVLTASGKRVRGSYMFEDSSSHVHGAKVKGVQRFLSASQWMLPVCYAVGDVDTPNRLRRRVPDWPMMDRPLYARQVRTHRTKGPRCDVHAGWLTGTPQ